MTSILTWTVYHRPRARLLVSWRTDSFAFSALEGTGWQKEGELFDAPDKILHKCPPFLQASPAERSAPGRQ